ncbi:hypothetical protein LTS08_002695 [Lithohypha guttulata]|uniref:D-3-phosphoglycerate dehydrogenase n=1 Tax=Lithohypha guttulata TaxID=1690604 RepID=A0AAN7TC26_9EURO|nr:hypothetical protein LTR51_001864 [Lithohypha guttulata]KAK5090404.1 hypothetical protein LTR05_000576 [Lithohypha guttulata]KAK5104802.1 hypothetical protein LTS08_002695 [Lithohypha guttulata]
MIAQVARPVIGIVDPYHPAAVERLESDPNIDVLHRAKCGFDTIYTNADAIIVRSETQFRRAELGSFQKLKYIVKQGVGVDNIDIDAAKDLGIAVYNTPGLNGEAVAELALALSLGLARRIPEIDRATRNGKTVIRSQTLGRSLFTKTLGIVGMGNIGSALAKKWIGAMEGEVIAFDPYYKGEPWPQLLGEKAKRVDSLQELLREADVVSLHVPLTKSTAKLISAAEFDQMRPNALLINCARGGIVDEDALFHALSEGKIGGAGLDATEIEPPTREHYDRFLNMENIILTPHVGASTVENQARSGLAVVDIVLNLVGGEECGNRLV